MPKDRLGALRAVSCQLFHRFFLSYKNLAHQTKETLKRLEALPAMRYQVLFISVFLSPCPEKTFNWFSTDQKVKTVLAIGFGPDVYLH